MTQTDTGEDCRTGGTTDAGRLLIWQGVVCFLRHRWHQLLEPLPSEDLYESLVQLAQVNVCVAHSTDKNMLFSGCMFV